MPYSDNPSSGSNSDIFPLFLKPGIKRDGTRFDGNFCVDGKWARFQRGRARKMGGWRSITETLTGPIRNTFGHADAGNLRVYVGTNNALQYFDVSPSGIGAGVGDRTPTIASGFVPNDNNIWQFAELYDSVSSTSRILAHAAPNLSSIDSDTDTKIFLGDIDASAVLVDSTCPAISGGVSAASPYAFAFGDDGLLRWCVPNTPSDWAGAGSGNARITRSKIVYGTPIRGGAGTSPASLFISTDSVIRETFTGGSAVFNFDTISSQTSILSSQGVIEYDGMMFWVGVDRFLMYNGVVQDVPNLMNLNWFFDNLNWAQRQKVWATKIPKFGEIWWHYPSGDSTECDQAIIMNLKENTWYDTQSGRSSGFPPQVFRYPVWSDTTPSTNHFTRVLNGTPASSAGVAANAFDGDPTTNCAAGVNGNISYDYGSLATKKICRVGIRSNTTTTYDLLFEYTQDFVTWVTLYDAASQSYTLNVDYRFDLLTEVQARGFRVKETGGAALTLQEVYFECHGYMVHQHEFGYDAISSNNTLAIESFIETPDIAYMAEGIMGDKWLGVDNWVSLSRIEPDLIQTGDMTITIRGRRYARDDDDDYLITFDDSTLWVDTTEQRRQMRFRLTSNTQGGFYELGQITIKVNPGDASQ